MHTTEITTILSKSDDTKKFTIVDGTIIVDMGWHDISIDSNPDGSITVNDETTYPGLDEFTHSFFQDYI